jgi:signal transduction histidine kinase
LLPATAGAVAAHQSTTDKHRLEIHCDEETLVGEWDAERLQRVVDNLISNAIKYSPEEVTSLPASAVKMARPC